MPDNDGKTDGERLASVETSIKSIDKSIDNHREDHAAQRLETQNEFRTLAGHIDKLTIEVTRSQTHISWMKRWKWPIMVGGGGGLTSLVCDIIKKVKSG